MISAKKPYVLIILDGWGYTENTVYNAIHSAKKPVWSKLWGSAPHTLIQASGTDVGLPAHQMGNSEVGHMTIGAGRLVDQEFSRITRAIKDGSFDNNEILNKTFNNVARDNKAAHILGLLSPGGVHGHQDHIAKLIHLAAKCKVENIYLHAFLDGRDTPPQSAGEFIRFAQLEMKKLEGRAKFASIIGRFYAMDRNKRWDRTLEAYDLITQGKAAYRTDDPFIALDMAYARGDTDEFVSATAITQNGQPPVQVEDGDAIIFANYRADRARQLARALTKKDFKSFYRERVVDLSAFVSLTEYKPNYEFPVAFAPQEIDNVFGEYVANIGLQQLRIAETEKYAHVTFFLNGGREQVFAGEDRILVPSPWVRQYSKDPEMSAFAITDHLTAAIRDCKYDVIVCNYANADMVGHTGDFQATIKAIETIDACLGKVIEAAEKVGAEIFITADHGNAEQMKSYDTEKKKSSQHTAHTLNLVPFIYVGREAEVRQNINGTLADIVPTILSIMGLDIPAEMTGKPLFQLK